MMKNGMHVIKATDIFNWTFCAVIDWTIKLPHFFLLLSICAARAAAGHSRQTRSRLTPNV